MTIECRRLYRKAADQIAEKNKFKRIDKFNYFDKFKITRGNLINEFQRKI
jgi:hypothetical protein